MEITEIYAIVVGGVAFAFLFRTLCSVLTSFAAFFSLRISKHLIYPYVLDRHALLGPWSAADVLVQSIYLAVNLFCITFRVADLSQAGNRSGTLCLINLGPLFAGPHLDFLADLLGLPLKAYRCVHRSAGLLSFALAIFHVLAAVAIKSSTFQSEFSNPLIIIVGASGLSGGFEAKFSQAASTFCLLIVLSRHIFKRPSYEIFLRTHQALAILCAYSIWRHVPSKTLFPRIYLYIFAGLFGLTSVIEGITVIHRNGVVYHERSHAVITQSSGTVKLKIRVSSLLKVEPGQYINLWMPSVSFWAPVQSHPFVVTTWADTPMNTLDLFVVPRRGFTRQLLDYARDRNGAKTKWVIFSGPHGKSIPVGTYETVLLVADGAGIAAQLPYLKKLIHGYHTRRVLTRRIHLVWQIGDIEVGIAAQPLLNEALDEDKLENGGILQISIYVDMNDISTMSFGRRSTAYPGTANLQEILREELKEHQGEYGEILSEGGSKAFVNRTPDQGVPLVDHQVRSMELKSLDLPSQAPLPAQGKTLVSVSGYAKTRDLLRALVRRHLEERVELAELDYQPS